MTRQSWCVLLTLLAFLFGGWITGWLRVTALALLGAGWPSLALAMISALAGAVIFTALIVVFLLRLARSLR